ncbi:CENP-B homolog protein 2-like protein [Tanacetum coccineum]|uniref:CENP-B homolog protein 2-like protein n=1 Tax=Tanacetum coccineum TaxID=301880 RepID=A0ABQ5FLE9_9ASTR
MELKISGVLESKSGSVEMEGMEDKLKSIGDKVDQFEMKDIFNMDETGLFFRLQPDHSLATMQLEGKKQDKERLTVAICCNEDGSEKLPLWIIGKYAKPRMNGGEITPRTPGISSKSWGFIAMQWIYVEDVLDSPRRKMLVDSC